MKMHFLLFSQAFALPLLASDAAPSAYNFKQEFINMSLSLVAILSLVFVTVYVLRRLMRSRIKVLNKQTGIKVLERRALGQKSSLYLVDVLGKGLVISESPSGIHSIAEFPPGTDVELLLAAEREALSTYKAETSSPLLKAMKKFVKAT